MRSRVLVGRCPICDVSPMAGGHRGTKPDSGGQKATSDAVAPEKPLETAAITAGVVAVLGVVASLTAAGAMQRIMRNHPWEFALALGVVLFGGLLWLWAGLEKKD